jgi:S1-C subfamily serine protease
MKLSFKQLTIYLGLLSLGIGVGIWGNRQVLQENAPIPSPQVIPAVLHPETNPVFSQPNEDLNFIARAVQQVGPAVVRIDASRHIGADVPETLKPPFFRRFFGEENTPLPQERLERGTGSGFILGSDGHLLTNAHVVEGAQTVKVTLKDGKVYEGRVLGIDSITDVAVIKIEAQNLPTVSLGRSETLVPGEWAIAIGNPLGLNNTVTVGIISALDRSSSQVGVPDKRVRFIQTDAAINPGNSGGPLLNAKGEVIGINTAIRADAQGLGFAIPIETAQRIAQQLSAKGEADHPYLGIHMLTISENLSQEYDFEKELNIKLTEKEGVLVVKVVTPSPAEKAGFQPGDVIKKVGGKSVATATDVQEQVETSQIGQVLEVEIKRDNKMIILKVRPGIFPK